MDSVNRNGILAGGLWLIDTTKYIDRYPEPSRLATISEVTRSNGGGAFNISVDLARLGADFPLAGVGCVGDDPNGEWILQACRNHKIATSDLRRLSDQPTSCTDVMTEAGSGRRTFFYLPGANRSLAPDHFPLSKSSARILYLGYPGLLPGLDDATAGKSSGVAAVLSRARDCGMITAVDLVSADTAHWASIADCLPWVDLLFLNEWEAARLLGTPSLSDDRASAAELTDLGLRLLASGVGRAVILHCSRGAVVVPRGSTPFSAGSVRVPAADLRGTCGAGDALAAGFLLALHNGAAWSDCLELGLCSAATCLHDLSSSAGVRPWRDCLAYGRSQGFSEFS